MIFICDYDEFGLGRHIYTFEKVCLEVPTLKLGDDTTVIVLNTRGTLDDVDDEVKQLLDYIGGGKPQSELTRSLDKEVQNVKSSKKWRREFMTLLMRDNENKTLGSMMKTVSLIRKATKENISLVASLLDVDESFIYEVIRLIEEYPNKDDEEIAEMLVD